MHHPQVFLERIKEASTPTRSWRTCSWRLFQRGGRRGPALGGTSSRRRSIWAFRAAFATALAYYDSYRSERLPANLLQAQRDYFGAHTYRRVDKPGEGPFHTDWIGERKQPE